jgi:adenosylcobyric acid synthase
VCVHNISYSLKNEQSLLLFTMSNNPTKTKSKSTRTSSSIAQTSKSLAVLGTQKSTGKSTITAGLCRVLVNGRMRAVPFKAMSPATLCTPALLPDPQHRSDQICRLVQSASASDSSTSVANNSIEQCGYGEIDGMQAIQAEACCIVPRVEMNPVLIMKKEESLSSSALYSVFILGKQIAKDITFDDLGRGTKTIQGMVVQSHASLSKSTSAHVIVIDGDGSCAELNKMEQDVSNLPLVRILQCPWLLVATMESGGVFAQITGTKACISNRDWELCCGIIVNQLPTGMRGQEAKYFEPGPKLIEDLCGKPVFVVPHLDDWNFPGDVGIEQRLKNESQYDTSSSQQSKYKSKAPPQKPIIVILAFPHTAITNDLLPLEADSRFQVQWRRRFIPKPYPHTAAIILPSSTRTRLDLKWLHNSRWGIFITKHVRAGGTVLGIGGGYHMLGRSVTDPGAGTTVAMVEKGLDLLPIQTTITPAECNIPKPRHATLVSSGLELEGFQLHCGQRRLVLQNDTRATMIQPLLQLDNDEMDGLVNGRVFGTCFHGLLRSPQARIELLLLPDDNREYYSETMRQRGGGEEEEEHIPFQFQDPLDRLAESLESSGLDFDTLLRMLSSHKAGNTALTYSNHYH